MNRTWFDYAIEGMLIAIAVGSVVGAVQILIELHGNF